MKIGTIHGLLLAGLALSLSMNLFGREISVFLNGWASSIQVVDFMMALLLFGFFLFVGTGTTAMILGHEKKIKDIQAIAYMFATMLLCSTSVLWAGYSLTLMM